MSRFLWKLGGEHLPLWATRDSLPPVLEIAHSLSIINRFTGWTIYPYSVAQHAVLTSYLVEPTFALQALHHDDHECVVGDISSPMKRELNSPTLSALCRTFDQHNPFCAHANAAWNDEAKKAVARADLLAVYFEAIHLVQVSREDVDAHFGHQELTMEEAWTLQSAWTMKGTSAIQYLLAERDYRDVRRLYVERHNQLTVREQ